MFKIICFFVALLLVQSESHQISKRSVATDVDALIKTLSSTITTKTNSVLSDFNKYTTGLETYISNVKAKSNSDFTTAVKSINSILAEYKESAKSVDLDISSCSVSLAEQVDTLAQLEISVYSCANQIYSSFDSNKDAAKAKLEDFSKDVVQLQTEASTCLNDEVCLLGVKAKCLKYQSYLPLEILLYSDEILQEYLLAEVNIDKCTYDNSVLKEQYQILSALAKCVNAVVINAVNPSTSTSAPTLTTKSTISNINT